ncbi:DJ-1/PfpI family protein [Klebsiella aerogenes]
MSVRDWNQRRPAITKANPHGKHLSSKRQTQLSEMGVNVIDRPIVVDGNIITSQSPATAINVAFTLIEKLTSRANVEKIKEGMGFPLIVNEQNSLKM